MPIKSYNDNINVWWCFDVMVFRGGIAFVVRGNFVWIAWKKLIYFSSSANIMTLQQPCKTIDCSQTMNWHRWTCVTCSTRFDSMTLSYQMPTEILLKIFFLFIWINKLWIYSINK